MSVVCFVVVSGLGPRSSVQRAACKKKEVLEMETDGLLRKTDERRFSSPPAGWVHHFMGGGATGEKVQQETQQQQQQ